MRSRRLIVSSSLRITPISSGKTIEHEQRPRKRPSSSMKRVMCFFRASGILNMRPQAHPTVHLSHINPIQGRLEDPRRAAPDRTHLRAGLLMESTSSGPPGMHKEINTPIVRVMDKTHSVAIFPSVERLPSAVAVAKTPSAPRILSRVRSPSTSPLSAERSAQSRCSRARRSHYVPISN